MPLLKLRHTHISTYRELFLAWNSQVGQSRRLWPGPSAAAGTVSCGQSALRSGSPLKWPWR